MSTSSKHIEEAKIICPHCKGIFAASKLAGEWLARACSLCKKPLDMEVFAAKARKLKQQQDEMKKSRVRHVETSKRHRKIASLIENRYLAPVRFAIRMNAERHAKLAGKCDATYGKAGGELIHLARSRYFASEWYQCTNMSLDGTELSKEEAYLFTPQFDSKGYFRIIHEKGEAVAGGILGEWLVFETLVDHIAKQGGELKNARLLSNLYLPSAKQPGSGLANQTDLVILTEKLAIVCEIKNWRTNIQASPHLGGVISSSGENKNVVEEKPFVQARRGAANLAALEAYPADRVKSAVIFVHPKSLTGAADAFVDDLLIASVYRDGHGSFIPALEGELTGLEPVMGTEEVSLLANRLMGEYADIDGSKQEAQLALREKMREEDHKRWLAAQVEAIAERSQERHQFREEEEKKRRKAREKKHKANSHKDTRSNRLNRKQRLYELELENEDWDFLSFRIH